jgi:hypothetical protein
MKILVKLLKFVRIYQLKHYIKQDEKILNNTMELLTSISSIEEIRLTTTKRIQKHKTELKAIKEYEQK